MWECVWHTGVMPASPHSWGSVACWRYRNAVVCRCLGGRALLSVFFFLLWTIFINFWPWTASLERNKHIAVVLVLWKVMLKYCYWQPGHPAQPRGVAPSLIVITSWICSSGGAVSSAIAVVGVCAMGDLRQWFGSYTQDWSYQVHS